jgi:hypothetical protein
MDAALGTFPLKNSVYSYRQFYTFEDCHMQTETKPQRYLTRRDLAARYGGLHPRTITRWEREGRLPPSTLLPNGRRGWADTAIEAHERSLVRK